MKIYLVGGAIRDQLLNREIKDRDYVVVGSTQEEMLSLGYEKVGADFPVFLHPQTREEYALARTETKIEGKNGYHAFETFFAPNTTIEEDLARRDLTINAIAYDEKQKQYIDPYNGIEDLKNKILRHTTEAFKDDPLRILRLARFLTRYEHLGFKVAEETKEFCKEMIKNGELNHLTPERVWKEIEKVFLEENKPSIFFNFLQEIDGLKVILPELNNLKDVPQTAIHHPEICSYIHTMMVLDRTHELVNNKNKLKNDYKQNELYSNEEKIACLFSALTHDLGKGITPKEILPRHLGHEEAGVPLVKNVVERYKVPKLVKDLSLIVCRDHLRVHRALETNPKTLWKQYKNWDYARKPRMTELLTLICQADSQGRLTFENRDYPQREYLNRIFEKVKQEPLQDVVERYGNRVELLKENIYKKQLNVLKAQKQMLMLDLEIKYKLENTMKFQVNNSNQLQKI